MILHHNKILEDETDVHPMYWQKMHNQHVTLYLHHRIEPKEVQPQESGLWDIIIIHKELIRIAG